MAQEAHSEGNFYLEPRTPGNVPSVYSLQSVYGIQVAQSPGGLGTAWEIWKQRWWLAILVFLAVFTAVVCVIMFLPAIYQSTVTILIERHQVPEAFVQSPITGRIEFRLQTITQEVLSRSRLESLINRFDLYPDLRQRVPLQQVIERMRQDIVLDQKGYQGQQKQIKDEMTVAFAISYKGRDPQQVAQVANALASFYLGENQQGREQQAGIRANFLRGQLDEMQQTLEEQEQRLRQFKEHYMGELPEQLQANMAFLGNLNTQLSLNSEQRAQMNEQRTILARQLAELEGLEIRVTQREKLLQELAKLNMRYGEKHPAIVSLKTEIAALDRLLTEPQSTQGTTKGPEQGTETLQNSHVQQLKQKLGILEADLKALHAEEQGIRRSIALYQQRIEHTPQRDQELQLLHRDYDMAKGLYQSLLNRQEEAKLAEHLEQRQKGEPFRLLEVALPAVRPKEPNRRKLILMGFVGALGFAAGTILLAEHLHPSFHTVEELSAFSHVPVLVRLPRIVTRADLRSRRWRVGLVALSTILSLGLIVGSYGASKGSMALAVLSAPLQRMR